MKFTKITLIMIIFTLMVSVVLASEWVNDPTDCPATAYSQNCLGGEKLCGYDSGTVYCYDMTTLNAPGSSAETSSTNIAGFDGGYLVDCEAYDGGDPYCDNSGAFWCDRNSTCYNVNRNTTCTASSFGASSCGLCISGYTYCDGDLGNGCEIEIGTTIYDENNTVYNSTCEPECSGSYLDCDESLGNGCEILNGGECYVGELIGSYQGCSGSTGNCVVGKEYFETGTESRYSTPNALMWGSQYGAGYLINMTNGSVMKFGVNNSGCIIFSDGSGQCSSSASYTAGTGLTLGGSEFSVTAHTAITVDGNGVSVTEGGINGAQLADTIILDATLSITQADYDVNFDVNTLFVDGSANMVGIGTATPGEKLEVDGNINVTTGNDICIESGNCLSDMGTGSGDITAVNTAGKYITGGSASGDVSLLLNETEINATMDARDSDTTYTAGDGLDLGGTEFTVDAHTAITVDSNGVSVAANSIDGTQLKDTITLDANLAVTQGSYDVNFDANTLFVDGGVNMVGIKTDNPGWNLDVNGSFGVSSTIAPIINMKEEGVDGDPDEYYRFAVDGGDFYLNYDDDQDGSFTLYTRIIAVEGESEQVGINKENPDYTLDVGGNLRVSNNTYLATTNGNVGIGTESPFGKLHVQDGAILFNGTTGSTPVSGAGTRMMWIPDKAAFRAGKVEGVEWDDSNIGIGSIALGGNSPTYAGPTASGDYSTAIGPLTIASGSRSTAIGDLNIASGLRSMAFGYLTIASGDYSTAMGQKIQADGANSFGISLNNSATAYNITDDHTMSIMGGEVGIGTVSPGAPLHIKSDLKHKAFQLEEYSGVEYFQMGVGGDGDLNFMQDDGDILLNLVDDCNSIGINKEANCSGAPPLQVLNTANYWGWSTWIDSNYSDSWISMTTNNSDLFDDNGIGIISTQTTNKMYLRVDRSNIMVIEDSGEVGIGTTAPAYELDVSGDIRTTGNFIQGSTYTGITNTSWSICQMPNIDGKCDRWCTLQIHGGIITGCT